MNKHPKSSDILKVINVFKKVLPMALQEQYHLDMGQPNACGTVCCHAGWFWMGTNDDRDSDYISFKEGVRLICKYIGLDNGNYEASSNAVGNWAHKNPSIWGNSGGLGMFCTKIAFWHEKKRPDGAKNLHHIIDHWTEVYERVKALEDGEATKKSPEYPDLTKELALLPIEETSDAVIKKEIINAQ